MLAAVDTSRCTDGAVKEVRFGYSGCYVINRLVVTGVVAFALVNSIAVDAARGQLHPPGLTALESVSIGTVREGAPGNLVGDGLARHGAFLDESFSKFEITDVELPSRRAVALTEVMDTLFSELTAAIDAFHQLLLARAGRGPDLTSLINR